MQQIWQPTWNTTKNKWYPCCNKDNSVTFCSVINISANKNLAITLLKSFTWYWYHKRFKQKLRFKKNFQYLHQDVDSMDFLASPSPVWNTRVQIWVRVQQNSCESESICEKWSQYALYKLFIDLLLVNKTPQEKFALIEV